MAGTKKDDQNAEKDAPKPKPEYPEFLGAMLVKELRQGMRARLFVLPFVLIHVAATFALVIQYASINSGPSGYGSSRSRFFAEFNEPVWIVIWMLLWCVLPLGGLALLQQEASGRNVELLLLTKLSRWRIVLGKWFMMCLLGWLTFISLVPYLLVRYFMGGMDVGDSLLRVAYLLLFNAVFNAIAIGASGYSNYAMRILIACIAVGSLFFSMIVPVAMAFNPFGRGGGNWVWIPSILACAGLYAVFGLQLGRARLRLFEHPYEPPASRVIVALICCAPIFISIVTAMSRGYGGFVAMGLMIWFVLLTDRRPKMSLTPPKQWKGL